MSLSIDIGNVTCAFIPHAPKKKEKRQKGVTSDAQRLWLDKHHSDSRVAARSQHARHLDDRGIVRDHARAVRVDRAASECP